MIPGARKQFISSSLSRRAVRPTKSLLQWIFRALCQVKAGQDVKLITDLSSYVDAVSPVHHTFYDVMVN